MRGHFAYKRGLRVDKACYYIFAKDLKRFEAISFGPSASADEPVSDFKMTTWRGAVGVRIDRRGIYQKF